MTLSRSWPISSRVVTGASLLLDTHVLLWALGDVERLSAGTRAAIEDGRTRVAVSAASVWEISIKRKLGTLKAPRDLLGALAATRFQPLSITEAHALEAGSLPLHHRDPFDRMLVAQARREGLTLVTADRRLARYGVDTLQA